MRWYTEVLKVTMERTLPRVENCHVRFGAMRRDDFDRTSEGPYESFVVDIERFMKGVENKRAEGGVGG